MEAVFNSRRSVVHSTKGIVSSTQPLATAAGVKVLERGGNSAMAAVAVAAALAVLEPHMTGPGGDMFSLFYDASSKTVQGINGSGHTPKATTLERVKQDLEIGPDSPRRGVPGNSVHAVTVPGAVAGWVDVVEKWGNGKLTLKEILQPAVDLARGGFPVSQVSAQLWGNGVKLLRQQESWGLLTKKKDAPLSGEVFVNEGLAKTLELIGEHGKAGFYQGEVADAIVKASKDRRGLMTHDDLKSHESTFIENGSLSVPVSLPAFPGEELSKLRVHEIPPSGQGFVALQTLGLIKSLEAQKLINPLASYKHNSVEYLHILIETLKIAFSHADDYVSDLTHNPDVDLELLLSDEYLKEEAKAFNPSKASPNATKARGGVINPVLESDTVYLTTSDSEGNACSFINSIYGLFGSGIIPGDLGFVLQSRGANFNLSEGSRNVIAGGKRPYHVSNIKMALILQVLTVSRRLYPRWLRTKIPRSFMLLMVLWEGML